MKDKFWIFYKHFLVRALNEFHNIKHFWVAFLHFKYLLNEGQILNF